MTITPKHFIDLGYPFERWMLEAVKIAERHGPEADLQAIADHVSTLPQFKRHQMRDTPCTVYVNLDDEGEDRDFLIENKRQVVKTITNLSYLPTIAEAAVMPDACSAGAICVGGVVAARNAIHPAFHSADVCCSMFLTEVEEGADPKAVLDLAHSVTHFGPTRRDSLLAMPKEMSELIRSNPYTRDLLSVAERDLGTQGDGNHFLSVGRRQSNGAVCVVTHHGSRGFGARLFKRGLKLAQEFAKNIAPIGMSPQYAWIPMETQEGRDYWEALQIVRDWTHLNHQVIHDGIVEQGDHQVRDRFWNEHNFVFQRGELYYHAKGATPGWRDSYDRTLVPMNMAEPILITRGTEVRNGIGFLPHGAGRNMSRTTFKRRFPNPTPPAGVDLRSYSGRLDVTELPQAYKNAGEVKRQMQDYGLAEVIDEITPYGCIMAGEVDEPWRKKV